MAGVHLAIKVQQLPDAEEQAGLYCVLSTGSTRFSTSKASAAAELFLVSPWELSHATKKPLPTSHSTQHDHSRPLSSPVLTVELYSAKRWGADAVFASGELLLQPFLEQLQPNGASIDVAVPLAKSGSKAASKPASSSAAATAAGSSPGGVGANTEGPDAQAVLLQLSTVAAPAVPEKLLGPVGSGRAEVPPKFCADASWLNWQQPVLHTGAGHLYATPTVQLLRVTLHKAQGLHNLHVDPLAAAAAAAAIGRMGTMSHRGGGAGSPVGLQASPSRAKAVAERAVAALDSTKTGRNLLQHTSTWFKRAKSSAGLAPGDAAPRPSFMFPSGTSRNTAGLRTSSAVATASDTAAAAVEEGAGAGGTTATPPGPAAAAAAAGGSPDPPPQQVSTAADGAAAAAAVRRSGSGRLGAGAAADDAAAAAAAAAAAGSPRSLKHSLSNSSAGSGSGSAAGGVTGQQPIAPSPYGVVAAAEQAVEQAAAGAEAAAVDAARQLEQEAGDAVGALAGGGNNNNTNSSSGSRADGSSLADPVTVLQKATQHTRNSSVDAEAVMAALEENGFHATDAYMGAFFYTRVSLVGGGPDGSSSASTTVASSSSTGGTTSHCSRVVALELSGEACWDQGFWLPLVRPAPANAALELELFAAKDDKTRGRAVACVRTPLSQLLPQDNNNNNNSQQGGGDVPWGRAQHVLQASFSDHLHCSFSVTVEVADWDLRAQLGGIPRALGAAAAAAVSSAAGNSQAAAAAGEAGPSVARTASSGAALPQAGSSPVGASPADSPRISRQRSGAAALAAIGAAAEAASGAASSGAAGASGSSSSSSSGVVQPLSRVQVQQPPPVAGLDLVVKAFDTTRALDVFFVLLLGPYCLVSSTSHSTQHHHWGWHLRLPLTEPADILTLALLAREDQAGGRKKTGASLLTLFSGSSKLVGKLRIRLSTLPANTPLNLSMPLQGERTNLRAGPACAATAHLYLHLVVPQLLGRYLPSYARFSVCSPALYLLANSPGVVGAADSSLEALAAEVQATTARWVEQQPPMLPGKVFRKVQDDGRAEFTLSRTRANWRRLTLLRDATAPARAAFSHLCSWDNAWHSGGWYCVILLFGVFPSKVLSVMLVLLAGVLLRKAMRPAQAVAAAGAATAAAAAAAAASAGKGTSSKPPSAASTTTVSVAAASAAAAAGAVVIAGGGDGGSSGSWRLVPVQPPPVMWDPFYAVPEEAGQQGAGGGGAGGALPTDPYTNLKQNYEAVITFLTLVQNVIDVWASAGERLQLAFSWTDPLATGVLVVVMLLLALGLWVLGLQVLVTAGLLWVFRHPILRTPLPPPPVNFVGRLPTRSDTMM